MQYWLETADEFAQHILEKGLGDATFIYAYSTAANGLFNEGKRRGLGTILDHATAPARWETDKIRQAWEAHPQWFPQPVSDPFLEQYALTQEEEWKTADRIVVISRLLERMIKESGGNVDKCSLVPLAVDIPVNERRSRVACGEINVGFVGDDGLRKGVGDFLTACDLVGLKKDQVHVAGAVHLSREGLAEAERIATLHGRLDKRRLNDLFGDLDVFVLPSYSDTFGIVVLEAMAHGAIPIVSENTGASDVIANGRNGFVVPVGDVKMLAEKLRQLATDKELRVAMAKEAEDTVKSYSSASLAKLLDALLLSEANRRMAV